MKLTKRQRAKLLTQEDRAWAEGMEFERLLALHDLTHELMERSTGTNRREEAERLYADKHAERYRRARDAGISVQEIGGREG